MSAVRRLYQQARWRTSGSDVTSVLLRLLGNVPGRQRGALAEEEVFHVLGHELLCFFLPRHQPVLVQDHLHAVFPQFPGFRRDVLENPLAELAGPRRGVEPWKLLLKLDAEYLAAAGLAGRGPWGRGVTTAVSHYVIVPPAPGDRS